MKAMKNYTKHLTLFLLAVSLVSCSKDDDAQSQETNKLLERMNFVGNLVSFFYNEDNTIERFETANYSVGFAYTNNYVSSIVVDENEEYLFQYDTNGKIDYYSTNGQDFNVDYDSAAHTYSYEMPNGFDVSIELYDNDEVKRIIVKNLENVEVTNFLIFYDLNKKGPMYNSNSFKVQYYIATTDESAVAYVSPKHPLQLFTINNQSFSFANTYDEDGFVVRADAGVDGVMDYFYSE